MISSFQKSFIHIPGGCVSVQEQIYSLLHFLLFMEKENALFSVEQTKKRSNLFENRQINNLSVPKKMAALSKSKMLFHIFCCHPAGIPTYEENFNYGNEGCAGLSPNFPLSAQDFLRSTEMDMLYDMISYAIIIA